MKVSASKSENNIKSIEDLIYVLNFYYDKFKDKNLTAEVMNYGTGNKVDYRVYFTWEEEIA